jgi:PKD domain-containing protein
VGLSKDILGRNWPVTMCLALIILLSPTPAFGAPGSQLDAFVPELAWGGRAVAVLGSTAYISSQSEYIMSISLPTHAKVGFIDTSGQMPGGFGALTFDNNGTLWSADSSAAGEIYRVDQVGDTMDSVFAAGDLDTGSEPVDGLAIDSDGTIWFKRQGVGGKSIVYHVEVVHEASGYGYKLIGTLTVPFAAAGIAVDGPYLWLADTTDAVIYRYSKQGDAVAAETISAGEFNGQPVRPVGLALDYCTFPGKVALWTYGQSLTSGPLVAYELRSNPNPPACPTPAIQEQPADRLLTLTARSSDPNTASATTIGVPALRATAPGGRAVAGTPILFEGLAPGDRTGNLFGYKWDFGDGSHLTGHGRVHHTYRCAGTYEVSVTAVGGSNQKQTTVGKLNVAFPASATKTYNRLRLTPHISVTGRMATAWLSFSGRHGPFDRARTIEWTLGNHRGRSGIHAKTRSAITPQRNHALTATTRFPGGHNKSIHTCFYG